MNRIIGRSCIVMLLVLAFTVGSVAFVFDYMTHSKDWVMTPGSPHIYTDYSAVSGTVLDREGYLLMDTTDGRIYSDNETLRKSIIHWLGDRQGNIHAPMLSHYAAKMTGHSLVNGLYVYGNQGGKIQLTLSAKVQIAALEAMGDRKGTVAVYNYKTGELLCAVTTPTFDPDNLPDIAGDTTGAFEGAYLNRFVKSVYPPGSIFKIVTAAAALEHIPDIQQQTFDCSALLEYGIDKVTCLRAHGKQDFFQIFRNSCNCAFAQIADQLGGEVLQQQAEKMGITGKITFDGMTTAAGNITAAGEADVMVAWSAIGQHKDQINPCQFLTMMGAIANGGVGAEPYVVKTIDGGKWGTYTAVPKSTGRILGTEAARVLGQMLRNNVADYYGDENFPGLTVCGKSGTAELGGDKEDNAMFTGFVADEEYPLAFICVLENSGYGQKACVPVLSKVLSACKDLLDSQ